MNVNDCDTGMTEEVYLQRIRDHIAGGRGSGVRATPTFFINGKSHDVSFGIQKSGSAVDAALRK